MNSLFSRTFGAALTLVLAALLLVACSHRDTLAKVDGQAITKQEFDNYLKFKHLPVQKNPQSGALLDQYLQRKALADVISDQKDLDQGLIKAELEDFRTQMLISRYFDQYLSKTVDETAVRNYYNAHPDQFQHRQVHVAHILFRLNSNMSEAERKAKLTAAEEAYSKLKAGGNFAKIAAHYSEDKVSAKKGGDLGWLKEGAIDPRFSKTVFSMKPGEISKPFETAYGFHIVKVLEGPVEAKQPFEAVEGDIRYQLRNQAKAAEIKRLLSQADITKYKQ
jgi:peptidyl-prolyl cis-trans isomerase C